MTLPRAYIARHCRGQVRFKIPRRKGNVPFFDRAADVLGGFDGVDSVEVNPLTGSILTYHRSTAEDLAQFARKEKLFQLAAHAEAVPPRPVSEKSGSGALDLRTTASLGVLLLALIQMARGQILGPATTLLWIAWQIADQTATSAGENDSD